MTEAEAVPDPQAEAPQVPPGAPEVPPTEPLPGPRRSALPWLCLFGFLVLAAAIALAWLNPRTKVPSDAATLAALNGRLDQLSGQLAGSETKLAELAATETKLAGAEKALVARPGPPDVGPIEARLAALETRPLPAPAAPNAAQMTAALAPLSDRIDGLEKSLAALGKRLGGIERQVRITAAAGALGEGRPLGDLPGAPPALARFARTAPPTLAALRLSFPQAASAESASARPSEVGQPLMKRMMLRLGDLFTLREGNQIIIGNPAEPALTSAEAALDAGDLAAAVAALASLPPPLAAPMLQWEDQAKALLAANDAMASFASGD